MPVLDHAGRLLAPLVLALACAACAASGGSGASCVGPYLDDHPPKGRVGGPTPTVGPGASITIYGHWYTSTCNDTGQQDPLQALPPVHLVVTLPGGVVQDLGEFTPEGADMGFSAVVRVPATTPTGTASIHDDRSPEATFMFAVDR